MMPMNRRDLLRTAALSAAILPTRRFLAQTPTPGDIKQVLVVFKCHLDVGFTDTQANVMRKYFDVYFPQAIKTAAAQQEGQPYTWTTGSWLLYEYLEQANAVQRKAMEQAIASKQIAWHALPFSWQTEAMDSSLIEGGISFSEDLDRRFGMKTTGAKMTDVPGHTRGIIAPLAQHGVKMLDIGVNAASTPPDIPDLSLWQDASGAQIILAYHRMDYGGTILVPGSSLAFVMQMRSDNGGPHTTEEIAKIYADLQKQFPNAQITASSLSDVANAMEAHKQNLPVVKEEIGDTWIHGLASDPPKLAQTRELIRLRQQWLHDGKFKLGDATDRQFLRRFLLSVEHTWGTDTKRYIDVDHYRPAAIATALQQSLPGYMTMEASWREKRDDITSAVASLPSTLQSQAAAALQGLEPVEPSIEGMHPVRAKESIETPNFYLSFDTSGAITRLQNRKSQQEWASPKNPLALFTYQTLSLKEFSDFIALYIHSTEDWAFKDFGKPNIDHFGAQTAEWHPQLTGLWTGRLPNARRIVAELAIPQAPATAAGTVFLENVAPPRQVFLDFTLPNAEPVIYLTLSVLGKRANRMPEALWLTFNPAVAAGREGWTLDKANQPVLPSEVLRGGNRTMHAVTKGIHHDGPEGVFNLDTLDAPLIAVGERSPLNFSKELPPMDAGFHVNLFNNAWGTNYPQWRGGDWAFRFVLRAG
jgi:hypothetical protein